MTDSELVTQVLNGNQHACRFLVIKYQNLVHHMVRRMVLNDADIEDLCQDVFMKVFHQLGKFRGDCRLSTWIATIAYHTSLTHLKKKKTRNETDLPQAELTLPERSLNSENGYLFESEEIRMILLKTIETIPVHYRSLLTLFYLEGFSYPEMEKITGMPVGTIKNYLFRARYLLKCKLEKIQENEKAAIFVQ